MFKAELMGASPSQANCHTKNYSSPKQNISDVKLECCDTNSVVAECVPSALEKKLEPVLDSTPNKVGVQSLRNGPLSEEKAHIGGTLQLSVSLEMYPDAEDKSSNHRQSGTPSKDSVTDSVQMGGGRVKTTAKSRKKYTKKLLRKSDRVLRSRSQEKPKAPETSANQSVTANTENMRKKRKKKRGKKIEADEYMKIRANLRYLLNRINYEQSLITAYSSEGWKGLSLEKLKPEKELQRATAEILRRKSKIRDLFQRLESLCAEGSFPESLFDSDGLISSEDIFCAKCGSKDLTLDNDIILCDGVCDRGFHQFCLVPPLLKEDIPPGDEGWLCPGCDCKVDCIKVLNDNQGTSFSISDSWEKLFPEAAAGGQNSDPNFGLPSDDSDDDDFDPDNPQMEEKSQGDESSSDDSDDSDFTSDEMEAAPGDKQQLEGLSSEDSEDDDFDPDAPDPDENEVESSSSDFTSASEDLGATIDDNELSSENKESNRGRKKRSSFHDELGESDLSEDASAPIFAKRNVERLDYQKLYDETYGNASSDSSDDDFTDDQEFTQAVRPTKRRKSTKAFSVSANGNTPVTREQDQKGRNNASQGINQKSNKRLRDTAIRELYKSFNKNKYPDRATKDDLAKELGLTYQQVDKWFGNARWSFNHSPSVASSVVKNSSENNSPALNVTRPLEPGPGTISKAANPNGTKGKSLDNDDGLVDVYIVDGTKQETRQTVLGMPVTKPQKSKIPSKSSPQKAKTPLKSNSEKLKTPASRKRKNNSDDQASDSVSSTKEDVKTTPAQMSAGKRVSRRKSTT